MIWNKKIFPQIKTDIYLYLLLGVAFTLPFDLIFNNVAIGLLLFYWLFTGRLKEKLSKTFHNKFFWIFSAVFFIQVLGLLYTEDIGYGIRQLEKKASLVILPLIILSSRQLHKKEIILIILSFAFACFILFAYAISSLAIFKGPLLQQVALTEVIDETLKLHHAYSGAYLAFVIISIIYLLHTLWKSFSIVVRTGLVVFTSLLFLFLVILGARMALFITFFVLGIQILTIWSQRKNYRSLLLILATSLFGLLTIFGLPSTRLKVNEFLVLKGVYHPFTPRIIQWGCCIDILNENKVWLQGVGTGDVTPFLQSCYQKKQFWGHLYKYNAHNEYMEELVRLGLLGLTVFVFSLVFPLISAFRQQNYLYAYFILVFMLVCVTESFLSRQKGVIFYAFFNAVLIGYVLPIPEKDKFVAALD